MFTEGYLLLAISFVLFMSSTLINARECSSEITKPVSQIRYETIVSTYSRACGFLWLSRCRRTRTRMISLQVYQLQTVGTETQCCDGYQKFDNTCIPVCNETCEPPRYCQQPNVCGCLDSGYTGQNCENPICSNGCPSNQICVAPDTCQCPSGFTGDRCMEDIDECEAVDSGICEQKCINNRGSYTCDCRESFVIGNDAQRCVGTVNMSVITINSSVLMAQWNYPYWDTERLINAYNITCFNNETIVNDTVLNRTMLELGERTFNLNTEEGYQCCITVLTLNGNGPQSCISVPPIITTTQSADAQSGSELVDSDAFKIGLGVIVACATVLILIVIMITAGYVAWKCKHKKEISFTSAPLYTSLEEHSFQNELYGTNLTLSKKPVDEDALQYNDTYLENRNEDDYDRVRDTPYHYVRY